MYFLLKKSKCQNRIIEKESRDSDKSAFEILVEEWGTMGKKRPNVRYKLF